MPFCHSIDSTGISDSIFSACLNAPINVKQPTSTGMGGVGIDYREGNAPL